MEEKATDELYPYYNKEDLILLSSIRNFYTHKEDEFTSAQFDLAKEN